MLLTFFLIKAVGFKGAKVILEFDVYIFLSLHQHENRFSLPSASGLAQQTFYSLLLSCCLSRTKTRIADYGRSQ